MQTEIQKMTPEQERSMGDALARFREKAESKYRAGQAEHGGNLWDRSQILDEIENEVIDQWFYVQVLRQKLNSL